MYKAIALRRVGHARAPPVASASPDVGRKLISRVYNRANQYACITVIVAQV